MASFTTLKLSLLSVINTYGFLGVAEDESECRVEFDVHDAHVVSVQHRDGFTGDVRVPHPDPVVSTPRHQSIQFLTVVKTLNTLKQSKYPETVKTLWNSQNTQYPETVKIP